MSQLGSDEFDLFDEALAQRLEACAASVREPIRFADMDAYGHINNSIYFRLFEQARMAYLTAIDLLLDLNHPGVGPILAETRCRFRLPVTHPDTVVVGTTLQEIGPHWFIMSYVVASTQHRALAAEGDARIVVYDYARGQKTALPDAVRARMDALEKPR